MSKANEAAFPAAAIDSNGIINVKGMTKREYFAAKAMQGVVHSWQQMGVDPTTEQHMANQIAHRAVEFADALISELEKSRNDF